MDRIYTLAALEVVALGRALARRWTNDAMFGDFADAIDSLSEIVERLVNERDALKEWQSKAICTCDLLLGDGEQTIRRELVGLVDALIAEAP